jgi:FKBP-type peptidyl-prolyl cis-trans isomerase
MENKNVFFVTAVLILLFAAGAYYVYKIPSPVTEDLSQNIESSDTINDIDSGSTLGLETNTAIASGSADNQMNEQLITQDLVVGTGAEAVSGKRVTVNYLGTLTDGTKFDSSYDRNEPFSFSLGAGEVIAGWDQGFTGMKVGGKRKLTIPPSLGYGSADLGAIPPSSTLVFEVELLKVE